MSPLPTIALLLAAGLTALTRTIPAQNVTDRDLPRLGHSERWIPPTDYVDLEIQRDGTLRVAGEEHDLHGVADALMTRNAGNDFGEEITTPTGRRRFRTTPVLIRAHRDTPAVVIAAVIRNLGVRKLGYWKVLIATTGNGVAPLYQPRNPGREHHTLRAMHTEAATTPPDLEDKLKQGADPWATMPVQYRIGPSVRWGDAVGALDDVFAAGFTTIQLIGERDEAQDRAFERGRGRDLQALAAATSKASTTLAITFDPFVPAIANQVWNADVGLGGNPTPTALRVSPAPAVRPAEKTAVERAVAWLASRQEDDGSFRAASGNPGLRKVALTPLGLTSLAATILRAHGSTLRGGPRKPEFRKAILFIREAVLTEARRGSSATKPTPLDRALAALALIEAQYWSSYKLLKDDATAAVEEIALRGASNPIVQAIQLQAIVVADFAGIPGAAAARTAAGREVEIDAKSTIATVAAAVFIDHLMDREVAAGDERVARLTAAADRDAFDKLMPLEQLLVTQALYFQGGAAWQRWHQALQQHLPGRQSRIEAAAGSWQLGNLDPMITTLLLGHALQSHDRFPAR